MFSIIVCIFSLFLAMVYVQQAIAYHRLAEEYKELTDRCETLYKWVIEERMRVEERIRHNHGKERI
jgi:hypothetical protein